MNLNLRPKGVMMLLSFLYLFTLTGPAHGGGIRYMVQVGAYKDPEYANKKVARIKKSNSMAFCRQEIVKGKGEYLRVYMGPYGSAKKARDEAKRLKKLGLFSKYFIRIMGPEAKPTPRKNKESEKSLPGGAVAPKERSAVRGGHKIPSEKSRTKGSLEASKSSLVIKEISFRSEDRGYEFILLHGDGHLSPSVLVSTRNREKRLIIKLMNVMKIQNSLSKAKFRGQWVKDIEAHHQKGNAVMEITVHLAKDKEYEVNQIHYRESDVYAIGIRAIKS